MATAQMSRFIQHLRVSVLRDGSGMTDGQLLESFVHERNDAPLAALVRRHGPMVWGVCCRLLRSHQDAEDAFQATFLVLVQKAAAIRDKEMVGNWLYGVAEQTAVRMRTIAAKRGVREKQVTEMPEPAVPEQDLWNDLQPVLDQELSRLADKYRVLIILCDLEGKTRKEVARQLDVPEGTVAGRLARARTMLAARLARRGVVVSGGLLAALLSQHAASASVPTTVFVSTIKAATLLAAGPIAAGAISPTVAFLITGVTKAMCMTKTKSVMAVLLVVGLVCGATGLGVGLSNAGSQTAVQKDAKGNTQPAEKKGEAPKTLPNLDTLLKHDDPEVRRLAAEILRTLEKKPEDPTKRAIRNAVPNAAEGVPPVLGLVLEKTKPGAETVGLLVSAIFLCGPSDRAGIRTGDVITHIDKQAVTQPEQLLKILNQRKAGDKITLRVVCENRTLDVNVELVAGQQKDPPLVERKARPKE